MTRAVEIRPASHAEFETAVEWAAAEGWNPGLDDLAAFHASDPQGFLMGFAEGVPVSSISVVRYGETFGFLGFYIVAPDYRGQGIGLRTWRQGLARLEGRSIGLDGVIAQQDNYRKSGFVFAGRTIRFAGIPALEPSEPPTVIRPVAAADLGAVQAYDRPFFPDSRASFLKQWIAAPGAVRRRGLIAVSQGALSGYGVIRNCHSGFKIGPLFADDEATAVDLFQALVREAGPGAEVSIDVPEANAAGILLAERAGLLPVFETARMYRGQTPSLPLERSFGMGTLELG